jgi:hypothetical protein
LPLLAGFLPVLVPEVVFEFEAVLEFEVALELADDLAPVAVASAGLA